MLPVPSLGSRSKVRLDYMRHTHPNLKKKKQATATKPQILIGAGEATQW